jgi:hypothetical protein
MPMELEWIYRASFAEAASSQKVLNISVVGTAERLRSQHRIIIGFPFGESVAIDSEYLRTGAL